MPFLGPLKMNIPESLYVDKKTGFEDKNVFVLGGAGFLGRAICREAVRRGANVTSLNRSGAPINVQNDVLLSKVDWKKGSALDKTLCENLMKDKDFVVHSIGILFEQNSLWSLFSRKSVSYDSSYEAIIRDTTKVAVDAASKSPRVKGFAYISAADHGIISRKILTRYSAMKQESEAILRGSLGKFKKVVARPGFMFGSDRWITLPISLVSAATTFFTFDYVPRPISVDSVACAVLNELVNDEAGACKVNFLEVDDLVSQGNRGSKLQ